MLVFSWVASAATYLVMTSNQIHVFKNEKWWSPPWLVDHPPVNGSTAMSIWAAEIGLHGLLFCFFKKEDTNLGVDLGGVEVDLMNIHCTNFPGN